MKQINNISLRWLDHDPTFSSLMIGRIELAQISKSITTDDWFYTLRFCVTGEKSSYSSISKSAAKSISEAHAERVLIFLKT